MRSIIGAAIVLLVGAQTVLAGCPKSLEFYGEHKRIEEAKVGEGVPESWGDWRERAVLWETLTATALIETGADVLVLRHPETVKRVKAFVGQLMEK